MNHSTALLFLGFFATLGCAPRPVATVAHDAEHRASVLEELRSRAREENLSCPDWCTLSDRMAKLSNEACTSARNHPEREEDLTLCAQTQEDLARFRDQCAPCRK